MNYTRKIDREYNRILFNGSDFGTDSTGAVKTNINPNQMQLANDYLVKEMFGKTDNEIDEMNVAEFNKLLQEVNDFKTKETEKKKK